jgi:sphinganine-1-phosphate aldolase
MAGSRPGAIIAGTWASLVAIGESGYKTQALQIADVHAQITKGYREEERKNIRVVEGAEREK